jgi:hypothetical protein
MKNRILSLSLAALALTASSAAYAGAHVSVVLNPFGFWGPPPPVVYAPPRYDAPPGVYYGRGHWGERHYSHGRPGRDRGHDRRR